jgi:PAS domain-containing protein
LHRHAILRAVTDATKGTGERVEPSLGAAAMDPFASLRTSIVEPDQRGTPAPVDPVTTPSVAQLLSYREEIARLQAVATANDALRRVFDRLPIGVVWATAVRDDAGTIVDYDICYANALAREVLGRPTDEIIGRRCTALHPSPEGDAWRELTGRVVETGEPFHAERYPVELRGSTQDFAVDVVAYDDGYISWYQPVDR